MLKKVVASAALISISSGLFATSVDANNNKPMWDVAPNHSLMKHITKMVNEWIVTLDRDNSFKSESKVTRYQAARYIYNALYKSNSGLVWDKASVWEVTSNPFPDVPYDNFYAFYVNELKKSNMIAWYADWTYGWNNYLTRGEMIAILENARSKADSEFKVVDYRTHQNLLKHRFTDVLTNNVFYNYIYTALNNGYITNNPEYNTNRLVTKAEMSAMLNNVLYTPVKAKKDSGLIIDTEDNTKEPSKEEPKKDNTKKSVFYKWKNVRFDGSLKIVEGKKVALIIDANNIKPFIPYIDAKKVSAMNGTEIVKISKITLLKAKDGQVIYWIYFEKDLNTKEPLFFAYKDNNSTVAAKATADELSKPTEETKPKDETKPEVKSGKVEVTISKDTPTWTIVPADSSSVYLGKITLTAKEWDASVRRVNIKRAGFSDQDTLTALALFDENGRLSRARNDSQNNGTEASLNLLEPLKIKAGESKDVMIYGSIGNASQANWDKFNLEILSVETDTETIEVKWVKTEAFTIAWTNAPAVKFRAGRSSNNAKIWDKNAVITRFEIEWDSTHNTKITSITMKAINSDTSKNLSNVVLNLDGKKIAEGNLKNWYVSFSLKEKLEVEASRVLKLEIVADIVEGAGKNAGFYFDENLDVTVFYNSDLPAKADITWLNEESEAKPIMIEAGKLSIVAESPSFDWIKINQKGIVLGTLKTKNASGWNLELQKFGVKIKLVPWNAKITWNNAGSLTLAELFSNVYLETDKGHKYELNAPKNAETEYVYFDNNINHSLKEWDNVFKIVVDTNRNIEDFQTATLQLSLTTGDISSTTGWFYAIETSSDKAVTDITPSSITFNKIEGTVSSARIALLPLSNVKKVKGAKDVEAIKFEVRADSLTDLEIDEVTLWITANANPATSGEISEVSIYKNEVKDTNRLTTVSWNQLRNGKVALNLDQKINKTERVNFVATVSLVDDENIHTKSPIKVTLEDIAMIDSQSNKVPYTNGSLQSGREISIANSGWLSMTEDVNNMPNKYNKVVLAGKSEKVFSIDVQAENEPINVQELAFVMDKDMTKIVKNATLYLDGKAIATNSYSDTTFDNTESLIKFENLTNLIIPQETKELALEINSNTIWYEKVGKSVVDAKVTKIKILRAKWADSGLRLSSTEKILTSSKKVSFLPAIVNVTVSDKINGGQGRINVSVQTWDNTVEDSYSRPQVKIKNLHFTELSASSDWYTIYKSGESTRKWTISNQWVFANGTMTDEDLKISWNGSITYMIIPTGTLNKTYSLNLVREAITFDILGSNGASIITDAKTQLERELDLGYKSY